jgi:hypothetical protein
MIRPFGSRYQRALNFLTFLVLNSLRRLPFLRHNLYRDAEVRRQLPTFRERFAYYLKLTKPFTMGQPADLRALGVIGKSRYKTDLARIFWSLPRSIKADFLLGDITRVPPIPSLVKSRPIGADNSNGILLPLDAQRHFQFVEDSLTFEEKLPAAIWRGSAHHKRRKEFLLKAVACPCLDLGVIRSDDPRFAAHIRPYMPIARQLKYRYILSVEGKDVATNLKWIMSSNSLCLMPKPRYETWFMEGQLVPGTHYVEILDDANNLEEVIRHYNSYPEKAKIIIANAQAHTLQFRDIKTELCLSREVVLEYARLTGQFTSDRW